MPESGPTRETPYALGLTEGEVRRLQDILRREGEEVSLEAAWTRAIELLTFAKTLLEALPMRPSSTE